MATAPRPRSHSARGAEQMRNAWQSVRGSGGKTFGQVKAFFATYPPLALGVYFLLRGIWAFVGLAAEEPDAIAGREQWLTQALGALMVALAAMLCVASYRRLFTPDVIIAGLGSAGGLLLLEVLHVIEGNISPVYWLDIVILLALCAFMVYGWQKATAETPGDRTTAPPAEAGATPRTPAEQPRPAP